MTEQTTPYRPLTDVTWASLGGMYLNQTVMQWRKWGWPEEADLAHELHDALPFISVDSCRTLVSATRNALPILVTLLDGRREVGVVQEFHIAPQSSLRLQVWGFTLSFPMCTVAKVQIMTPDLLGSAGPVGAEPCGTCQRPTEIIDGQRRHSAWSGDHVPPNYDPDARYVAGTTRRQLCGRGDHTTCLRGECDDWEADPIDLQDEARGDFTPGL